MLFEPVVGVALAARAARRVARADPGARRHRDPRRGAHPAAVRVTRASARWRRRPSKPTRSPDVAGRIRVLIVDDHAMVRRGMRDFLDLHDDLEVVGEAADGATALDADGGAAPRRRRHGPADARHGRHRRDGRDQGAPPGDRGRRHHQLHRGGPDHRRDRGRRQRVPAQGRRGRRPGRGDPVRAQRRRLPRSGRGRDRRPADADRRVAGIRGGTAPRPRSDSSPRASATSSPASRAGCRTGPSPRSSGWPSGRPGRTSRTSWPSSA